MMPKKNDLERRAYEFNVTAQDDDSMSIIEGRPIVYGQRTSLPLYDEVIEAGALDKTDLRDVRFLVNHDLSKIPLARSRRNNGNSTMQLTVDEQGLFVRVQLDTENNTDARNLYSAVKRGDVSGMSFLFSVNGESWDDIESEHPLRRISEIGSVVEVSAVTFPAYESTEIYARSADALDKARHTVDTAKNRADELNLLKQKTLILGGNTKCD